jgi:hypothetical protein
MASEAIRLETLGTAALINYINELETNYKQQIKELEYKYLEIKEKAD